ncbi:MAG: hypothetical protein ACXADC_16480 [Candidatus Thorarchaeota archaeon]|jgi:hypothetical protein
MAIDVSKVRYISLIRMEGGESVLNVPYAEMTVDPDLIAGFVTAVIIFAKTPIRTIRKAAYDILIEVGETVLVLLVVDPVPDEAPYRAKLNKILQKVESTHGRKLRDFEGDVRIFRDFALNIIKEFPYSEIDLDLVPIRRTGGVRIGFRVGDVDKKLEQVEAFINGKRTVAEILDLIGLPEEEVLAAISSLAKYKWIGFKRRLTEADVLEHVECDDVDVEKLRTQYETNAVDELIASFDGVKTISEVFDSLQNNRYDRNALWFLVNKLVEYSCLVPA